MPWLAVPYPDEARRSRLNRLYGIQGILEPLPPFHGCGFKLRGKGVFLPVRLSHVTHRNTGTMARGSLCSPAWQHGLPCSLRNVGRLSSLRSCSPLKCPVQRAVDEVSLSSSPAKNVRNAERNESTLTPPPHAVHVGPTPTHKPLFTSVHMRRQEHAHLRTLLAPGWFLFLIRL